MCGIVGYVGGRQAVEVILDGLRRLEYRGYDSAGVACLDSGEIRVVKVKGKVVELEKRLSEARPQGTVAIGHTRWATHGVPSSENAHPHTDCSGRLAVVHNGIIENFRELKAALCARGHTFRSQTDSEVLPHLLEEMAASRRGDLAAAVLDLMSIVEGAVAMLAVSADAPDVLVGANSQAHLDR